MKLKFTILSRVSPLFFLLGLIFLILPTTETHAATYVVTESGDGSDKDNKDCTPQTCSLRDAIIKANSTPADDIITFAGCNAASCTYPLELGGAGEDDAKTGDLDILGAGGKLEIQGSGNLFTIIDGKNLDQVFEIRGPANVVISQVTIKNGERALSGGGNISIGSGGTLVLDSSVIMGDLKLSSSGGILNFGNLTVTNSTITGNNSNLSAGGIFSYGKLTIKNSAIINNKAIRYGGGLLLSGDVFILENVTISGNQADMDGGGVMLANLSNIAPTATFSNVTVTNNTADADNDQNGSGGGIRLFNESTLKFQNTIIAGNIDNSGKGPDCFHANDDKSQVTSLGYNLMKDPTGCNFTPAGFDLLGPEADPKLGDLADNGGPTFTHTLKKGSLAIDAGGNSEGGCKDVNGAKISKDQRGETRLSGRCDIGAFEAQPAKVDLTATLDFQNVLVGSSFSQRATFEVFDGDLPITITAIDVSGDGFSKSQDAVAGACSLNQALGADNPEKKCTLDVDFTPSSAEVKSGTLTFTTDDNGTTYTTQLTGNGKVNLCPNGQIDQGEACDGLALGNTTCSSLTGGAKPYGTPVCKQDCTGFNDPTTTCTAAAVVACNNNNIKDASEACDGKDFGSETCVTKGFKSGELSCSACQISTAICVNANGNTGGSVCPNGVIEGVEECDGANLGSATCVTKGFESGIVTCTSECKLDTTACKNPQSAAPVSPGSGGGCSLQLTSANANMNKAAVGLFFLMLAFPAGVFHRRLVKNLVANNVPQA